MLKVGDYVQTVHKTLHVKRGTRGTVERVYSGDRDGHLDYRIKTPDGKFFNACEPDLTRLLRRSEIAR